ncbi:vitamin K epoxide reductase family protein [Zhihengliuella flava]|uniref:Membrane protein n=1 Tax=Zhihengliuella flava TaxID=1285193 RepID=A0A931D9D7_9MICC|nr:vitamin K epoxide reductase family protein [Zhihengliuella flava]MBG6083311.1 putative membrane protein [Zhihengliuella flava]
MSETLLARTERPTDSARGFGWFLTIASTIAWLASVILVLERLELYANPNHVTSCDINPWVSCGAVMNQWQAALFGFPNPLIGIVGFAVVMTIGMCLVAGASLPRWFWIGLQIGITLAFAFIVWLWSQAVYEIRILCLYCMVVWAMTIPLFVLTTARNISHGFIGGGEKLQRFAREWAWVIALGLIVLVAATVVMEFAGVFFGG